MEVVERRARFQLEADKSAPPDDKFPAEIRFRLQCMAGEKPLIACCDLESCSNWGRHAAALAGDALCGNQSFEAAPFRGELMLFRRHFLDARRGGAERIRLVQAGA